MKEFRTEKRPERNVHVRVMQVRGLDSNLSYRVLKNEWMNVGEAAGMTRKLKIHNSVLHMDTETKTS